MLHSTTVAAASLKETLEQEQIVVEEKKAATEKLLEQLSVARARAEDQGELAKKEEDKATLIAAEAAGNLKYSKCIVPHIPYDFYFRVPTSSKERFSRS